MKGFWNFFLDNRNFSYIIVAALMIAGFLSVIIIPKESAPEVQVPVAVVTTVFPGSSAIDVERLITNKIEDQLANNLENVNEITSTSRDGISSVVVEFEADADIDKSVQDTKDEVDKVKADLPDDGDEPSVSDVNFVDQPVLTVSVIAELSDREFITLIDDLESELKKVGGVSKIQTSGLPEREAQVIVKKTALEQFGLSMSEIVSEIRNANSSLPVGSIELNNIDYTVTFEGDINDPREIRDIAILNNNGTPVYIRDIATVVDGVSQRDTLARVSIDGEPSEKAISLSIFKRQGYDVTTLSGDIADKLDELENNLLQDIPYLISFDNGEFVKDDLINLSMSALQTIALVMIILFLALGWREALIAGLAIPFSFLVAFIGLNYSGNTINFVSLFSLILSVGILVDSAIVVTESIHSNMKKGGDKIEAAKKTVNYFYYPLTTGTLTTIAVFAPLFLISGVTGQFIASIPFTIIFVLLASLFVALSIVPLFASIILKRRNRTKIEELQEKYNHKLETWYKGILNKIVGNRKQERKFFAILAIAFLITATFPFLGIVKVIFFPQENSDFLFIDVETEQGTVISQTDLAVRQVEEVLYQNENIKSFVTEVGRVSSFGGGTGNSGSSGEKNANITLILKEDRKQTSSQALSDLRKELKQFDQFTVRAFEPNDGPPTGAPIFIKLYGTDLNEINESVKLAEDLLASIPGTTEINSSAKTDATEFRLIIDRAKASQFGLSSAQIAGELRTALFGVDATTIKDIDGDIDVLVRLDLSGLENPENTTVTNVDAIKKLSIQSPQGPILVGSILSDDIGVSNTVISHEDQKRVGSVSSELTGDRTSAEITREFMNRLNEIDLPDSVEVSFGGENEEVNQSFTEMGLSLIVGVILVSAILVLQFNSFRHAFYIIAVIPLALIGVLVGLAIAGRPLSFPSIMGFIALAGIVVNNSIILIDTINKNRKENPDKDIKQSIIESSSSRVRPILLTTLTTVIGITPLIFVSELWAPLAFSIMFGLSFSVVVTLLLVPILYNRKPGKLGN